MRVLVISDIHANLVALESVLEHAAGEYDVVWCLGDLVGYGPSPNECVTRVRELPGLICLVGNHDKAALGEIDINAFNLEAQIAVRWTQNALTPETRDYLAQLPERVLHEPITLVHGSPRQAVWEYILDRFIAAQNLAYFDTPYCLVGHTHIPVIYREDGTDCSEHAPRYDRVLDLNGSRYIINPGSIGQPRDGNPDAAYALLDLDTLSWQHHRIPYDVLETQRRMQNHSLPQRLIDRLALGW